MQQLNIPEVKPLPDVTFVPAGMYYYNHGGVGIYVKWKGHGGHGTQVLSASPWNLHMILPDREVAVVGDLNKGSHGISFGDWDEFVQLSPFQESMPLNSTGINSYMVNAHQNTDGTNTTTRNHMTRRYRDEVNPEYKREIFGDSGGYQLKRKSAFIDPSTVAKFYNDNVDIGVVLDFPLHDPYDWDNLKESAEIQRINTEIMMQTLDPGVKLINTAHGVELEHRMDFLDLVHHPNIRSLSISKSYYGSGIMTFIAGVYEFIAAVRKKYGTHYNHIHILGMIETKIYLPIMRMAAKGLFGDMRITMDASTAIHTSTTKTMLQHVHSMNNMLSLMIGDDKNLANPAMRLPCSCPVCRALGWQDAFDLLTGSSCVTFPLMYHNIYALNNLFQHSLWYAANLDDTQMDILCKGLYKTNKAIKQELTTSMSFINAIEKDGYKKASKAYGFYVMDTNSGKTIKKQASLFTNVTVVNDDEFEYKDPEKDDNVYDAERMVLYRQRLDSLRVRIEHKAEKEFVKGNGRKKKKRPPKRKRMISLLDETTGEMVEKPKPTKKGKRRKILTAIDDISKEIVPVRVRRGASLKRHKQRSKVQAKPKVKSNKAMGKTVKRSDKAKKL